MAEHKHDEEYPPNTLKSQNAQEKIQEYYSQLNDQLSNLGGQVYGMLQRHENDFITAFKCQMYPLYSQLRDFKKRTEEKEIQIKRDSEIMNLQNALKWFQDETSKLAESAQYYKQEVTKLKNRVESLETDKEFLENQLKATRRQVNTLKVELESSRKEVRMGIEKEIEQMRQSQKSAGHTTFAPTTRAGLTLQEIYSRNTRNVTGLLQEVEVFLQDTESKYVNIIQQYKSKLAGELKKSKIQSMSTNFKIAERSELEQLFLNCVEQVKKSIDRRQYKTLLNRRSAKSQMQTNRPTNKFTSADQRKILELLLSNEQVLSILYEKLFPKGSSIPISEHVNQSNISMPEQSMDELINQVPKRSAHSVSPWQSFEVSTPAPDYMKSRINKSAARSRF